MINLSDESEKNDSPVDLVVRKTFSEVSAKVIQMVMKESRKDERVCESASEQRGSNFHSDGNELMRNNRKTSTVTIEPRSSGNLADYQLAENRNCQTRILLRFRFDRT